MRSAIRVAAVMTILLLATGCVQGCSVSRPPDAAPDLRGVVTSIDWSGDSQQGALVVWTDDPAVGPKTAFDAASVGFTGDTGYYREVGDTYESGSPSAISRRSSAANGQRPRRSTTCAVSCDRWPDRSDRSSDNELPAVQPDVSPVD
ncbi:MAG: hypothetical protein WBI63_10915 [Coriobacteriia bacterium]